MSKGLKQARDQTVSRMASAMLEIVELESREFVAKRVAKLLGEDMLRELVTSAIACRLDKAIDVAVSAKLELLVAEAFKDLKGEYRDMVGSAVRDFITEQLAEREW